MAEVRLEGICKHFGNTVAVAETNLVIQDGEFLVLVGPSGCGKSTTLRMVAGLEMPTGGEMYIGDKRVTFLEPKDRDIAMVFQSYALYPHKNVFENLAFGLRIRKTKEEEIKKNVYEIADVLEIGNYLMRYPRELSGGQRQRVALGRAMVRYPSVFLMDEPLSNLDAKLRVQTRAELIKLHERLKTTIVYVTHDQIEAMTMGTRIAVMKDGIIQQIGTPDEVYKRPANLFVAGFIGMPPMNFFHGKIVAAGSKMVFQGDGISMAISGLDAQAARESAILGIRPECIALTEDNEGPAMLSGKVEVVEHIGAEAYVHALTSGGEAFILRMNGYVEAPRTGQTIRLCACQGHVHLFDAASGANIFTGSACTVQESQALSCHLP